MVREQYFLNIVLVAFAKHLRNPAAPRPYTLFSENGNRIYNSLYASTDCLFRKTIFFHVFHHLFATEPTFFPHVSHHHSAICFIFTILTIADCL